MTTRKIGLSRTTQTGLRVCDRESDNRFLRGGHSDGTAEVLSAGITSLARAELFCENKGVQSTLRWLQSLFTSFLKDGLRKFYD
jgi:hypothetical protein